MTMTSPARRRAACLLGLVAGLTLILTSVPGPATAGPDTASDEYTNPVYGDHENPYADPAVLRGRDGYYYGYATGGNGMPITRSIDLVHWEEIGKVFDPDERPDWVSSGLLWGPEVTEVGNQYVMTYTVANTPTYPSHRFGNRAIGIATAPTPAGPWTDNGSPLMEPEFWHPTPNAPLETRSIMDTDLTVTPDGRVLLYYGGFRGGIWAVELTDDLTETTGEPSKLITEETYEAPFVMQRGGWYYLMTSSGRCCLGEVSGYTVAASRSRDPLGPFTDRDGNRMDGQRPGGTPVLGATGNSWTGVGSHTVTTDLGGQDWMLYHAIDRHADLAPGTPIAKNLRPMLLDRLDWIDGWPTVRAGAWASDQPTKAPAASPLIADAAERDDHPWASTTGWQKQESEAGRYWSTDEDGARLVSTRRLPEQTYARLAVRVDEEGRAGVQFRGHGNRTRATVTVDAGEHALLITTRTHRGRKVVRSPLPDSLELTQWHELAISTTHAGLVAEVANPRGRDTAARVTAEVPVRDLEHLSVVGDGADVDDITVAPYSEPVTERVGDPEVGRPAPRWSEEFADDLGPEWSWRRAPVGSIARGELGFPLQTGDLAGDNDSGSPSLLLREPPAGDWTVETKLRLDYGDAQPDAYPMAGLMVHNDDDNYVRLGHRAHGDVRQTTFTKEMTAGDDRQAAGLDTVGPPGTTTWLRLRHSIDPASKDHVYRAAVSTDGRDRTWGMAYTLDGDTDPRVGLFAHGADEDDGDWTPRFDYVRFYRSNSDPETPKSEM